jgi:hypothetical protein
MLEFLRGRVSDRKFLLAACYACRCKCDSHPLPVLRTMVAVCERWADGRATPGEVERMLRVAVPRIDSTRPARDDPAREVKRVAAFCAMDLFDGVSETANGRGRDACDEACFLAGYVAEFTPIVRCVFGNPFRPVAVDPAWLTSTVVRLAEGIHADRAFDRLPILADALQDAGCEDADILAHLRGDGPHVRGCWAVDLVLGKS